MRYKGKEVREGEGERMGSSLALSSSGVCVCLLRVGSHILFVCEVILMRLSFYTRAPQRLIINAEIVEQEACKRRRRRRVGEGGKGGGRKDNIRRLEE